MFFFVKGELITLSLSSSNRLLSFLKYLCAYVYGNVKRKIMTTENGQLYDIFFAVAYANKGRNVLRSFKTK